MPNQNGRTYPEYSDILLSTFGRPDVNGVRKLPLTEKQLQQLQVRIDDGILRGEQGHPSKDNEDEVSQNWAHRIMEIREARISHRIMKLHTEMVEDADGIDGKVQHITATVQPLAPRGKELCEWFDNCEPAYFGLRAMTCPKEDGTHEIIDIISWDWIQNDPYPPRKSKS